MTTRDTIGIGSWSEGSTRTENVASAALDMARRVGFTSTDADDLATWLDTDHIGFTSEDDHECECEWAAEYTLSDLLGALGEYAPIYCYVGMAEGDGASFGCFPSHDAIQEAIRTGVRQSDGTVVNVEDGVIIDVSDHGNIEVYELARGRSLLALV